MSNESKSANILLSMLMGIVILLMVAIAGLFIRMTQLQREVLAALAPFQTIKVEGLEIGTLAPRFQLSDTEGQTVSLADAIGQKVLLVFSSTACPACTEMYPHLEAFSRLEEGIQVIMISHGTDKENGRLVEEQGFDFPVLVWDDTVVSDYQVPGTPFFYVLDESGRVANSGFANSMADLIALVDQ